MEQLMQKLNDYEQCKNVRVYAELYPDKSGRLVNQDTPCCILCFSDIDDLVNKLNDL